MPLLLKVFLSKLLPITHLIGHGNHFLQASQVIGTEFFFAARYPNSILCFPSRRGPDYLPHVLQAIYISASVRLFLALMLGYLRVADNKSNFPESPQMWPERRI